MAFDFIEEGLIAEAASLLNYNHLDFDFDMKIENAVYILNSFEKEYKKEHKDLTGRVLVVVY